MINVSRSSRKKVADELFAVHLTVGSQSISQVLSLHSKPPSQPSLQEESRKKLPEDSPRGIAARWPGLNLNKK